MAVLYSNRLPAPLQTTSDIVTDAATSKLTEAQAVVAYVDAVGFTPIVEVDTSDLGTRPTDTTFQVSVTGSFLNFIETIAITAGDVTGLVLAEQSKTFNTIVLEITTNSVDQVHTITLTDKSGVDYLLTFQTLTLLGTGAAGVYSESFETGLGSYANAGTNNWTRDTGTTSSGNTGANGANDGIFFVYTEVSGVALTDTFVLITSNFRKATLLEFDLHMFGAQMGVLNVEVFDGNSWVSVFNQTGQLQTAQGDDYSPISIDLTPYSMSAYRYHYTGASGFQGDCIVDNTRITSV